MGCLEDIKRKYCVMRWEEIVDEARRDAVEYGYRRPWDGDDGESFDVFYNRYGRGIRAGQEIETLPSWIKQLKPDPNLPACTALKICQVEYNPMRNPPAEILSEGV